MNRVPVMVVLGTRPEAIKLAPVIGVLQRSATLRPVVVTTGQHRELLKPLLDVLEIRPAEDLDLMAPGQSLTDLLGRAVMGLGRLIREQRPAMVLVQGDTSTALAGALAAFHEQTPVGHVEAGLRTDDVYRPFPEEANRRLITRLAGLHFAPSTLARSRLLAEGVSEHDVIFSGNTVLDTLRRILARGIRGRDTGRRLALLTVHRRETWGEPLTRIACAVGELARLEPDLDIVFPAHPNPAAHLPFAGIAGVQIIGAVTYDRFVDMLAAADVVLTDSGGIQEEAPSLGTPVVLLRDTTERPEAIEGGWVEIAGTDPARIVAAARSALKSGRHPPADPSPFGDGYAAERIVAECERRLEPPTDALALAPARRIA